MEDVCDTTYHYCFKYPAGWQLTAGANNGKLGDTSQTSLLSPAKTVIVSYINEDSHDAGSVDFSPTMVSELTEANGKLAVAGEYSPAGGLVGNYLPTYHAFDSTLLATYPLTVGETSKFLNNPMFTDSGTGSSTYRGTFRSQPMASINTAEDAMAWLNSSDAKTSLLILKSLVHQP